MANTDRSAGADNIHWNLNDLYSDVDLLRRDLSEMHARAEEFGSRYRGHLGELSPADFFSAMDDLSLIQDTLGRAFTYVYLNWSTDTGDSRRGALLQEVRENYTAISKELLFFELEWAALDDGFVSVILNDSGCEAYRHYLEIARISRDYLLSEAEEKILVEKSITGASAWNRFFDETVGALRFESDDQELTQQEILARLHDADPESRKKAAASFTEGLRSSSHTLTYVFNTILADKATDDRLRGYPSWVSSRNLSNEVDDASVEALIGSVTDRYDIAARFYRLKRSLLGLEEMFDYDRYAPLTDSTEKIEWNRAREIVTDAYSAFNPEMGRIVTMFFENEWIDAALTDGKRGGAFSHGAVPSVHPYILMNYTGRVRDVQTLAHELGHGIHQYLSREQGIYHADTPLTTAETASVFGEMLVFQRLLGEETDSRARLSMLMGKIDDTMATVFRQVAMNRFEARVHGLRREHGELSCDAFSEAWIETQEAMFQGSVTLTGDYKLWWSYIPHFLHTPGYVYAYAFGELLVLALYERFLAVGTSFSDQYLDLLRAGGSDWPHNLLKPLGIDLRDAEFWNGGVAAIARLIDDAESLAGEMSN